MRIRAFLGGVGFAALLMLTGSVVGSAPAYAQRWEDCRDRIEHAQRHLDHMIDRFGRYSDAARDARIDLERTRDWCYSHNRNLWDPGWHEHDWHDHDWHDHHW